MKKILIITYYWPPSGGAGVQRALKFVKYLPEFNIQPIVLTVDETRASYPVLDESLLNDIPKDIKIYKTNSFEPLKILSKVASKKAIPYGGFSGQNKEKLSQRILRFIRGNFFIPDARVGWVKYAFKEACRIIETEQIDTILISSPPHSSQLIGLKLKKKYPHLKYIADLRDPWTDIYYYHEMLHTSFAKNKDLQIEKEVVENADAILTVSEDIKQMFYEKSSIISENKIHAMPNGYDEDDFDWSVGDELGRFIITYIGTMSDNYHPQVFFYALKKLIESHPEDKIIFRFVGNATGIVYNLVEELGLKNNCEFIPHVTHRKAIEYMLTSSILLLILAKADRDKGFLSGKIFEYLNARKMIIGLGPHDGEAVAMIKECDAGNMFNREQPKEFEDYLEELFIAWKNGSLPKLNSKNIGKYSRRELSRQFALIINELT